MKLHNVGQDENIGSIFIVSGITVAASDVQVYSKKLIYYPNRWKS
jgi:hypothetical protein